ncbi:hypothetical protein INS49_000022 [Diaporthe citri]|uniref:uncharacterized protein n=1 Tax=Diaporthe citri TaxID=83186 RepID=UPI001C7EFEBB|nr:uncharacterized protein INS49_000022 [Diaporthe citri]KAG6365846.1 hypothetical protein INS49_000022 [Diaporthe citri]
MTAAGGNSTRKAIDGELFERFSLVCCEDGDCRDELDALGIGSEPPAFTAFAPPANVLPTSLDSVLVASFEVPQQTASLFTPALELDYNHEHDVVKYIVDVVKLRG